MSELTDLEKSLGVTNDEVDEIASSPYNDVIYDNEETSLFTLMGKIEALIELFKQEISDKETLIVKVEELANKISEMHLDDAIIKIELINDKLVITESDNNKYELDIFNSSKFVSLENDVNTLKTSVNELSGTINNKANISDIPTKTSQLENDSNFATQSYVQENGGKIDTISVNGTDQVITNKKVNISIPTKTSQLENDSGFSTFSGNYNDLTNKPNLATVATSGSYSDLTNKPTNLVTTDTEQEINSRKTFNKGIIITYSGDLTIIPSANIQFKMGNYEMDIDYNETDFAIIHREGREIKDTLTLFKNNARNIPYLADIPTNNNQLTNGAGYVTSSDLLSKIYPVGSIYMSANSTSPASFLGGTWEQLKDRFLIGAGGNYSNGTTGGEATHTLTIDEIPRHEHYQRTRTSDNNLNRLVYNVGGGSYSGANQDKNSYWVNNVDKCVSTEPTGGGQAHNNMPPYLSVYMWKRTA